MSALAEYAQFCGPRAHAAISGYSREAAAGALARWSRKAGWAPSVRTSPTVLAGALMALGYRFESWSAERFGWRTETAPEFSKRIFRTLREDCAVFEIAVGLLERSATRDDGTDAAVMRVVESFRSKARARRAAREAELYTVGEWRRRFAVGTWVLLCRDHVCAVRAGQLATSGRDDDMQLREAWRVLPRSMD